MTVEDRYSAVPEWAPQAFMWVGWPSDPSLWRAELEPARRETAEFVQKSAGSVPIRLVAAGATSVASAADIASANVTTIELPMGDIWLRDTGPMYVTANGALTGVTFRFNGWGGKYVLSGDQHTAAAMLDVDGLSSAPQDFVLEGGAFDHDGAGQLITTRQCLLNPNRNPGWKQEEAERALVDTFALDRIIWLDEGLLEDHTDGHVDNIARFIGPSRIVCQHPSGDDDPNTETLMAVESLLRAAGLEVITLPSPGKIVEANDEVMPASHLNFVFANDRVIMPCFEDKFGPKACDILQAALPDHEVIASPARHILSGGGAFHCMTSNVPALGGLKT
ncbi:MAG: agmatine deiminase family protein [Pseudomonadota bacterium]